MQGLSSVKHGSVGRMGVGVSVMVILRLYSIVCYNVVKDMVGGMSEESCCSCQSKSGRNNHQCYCESLALFANIISL